MNGEKCLYCQAPLGTGKRFCSACGKPVALATAAPPPPPPPGPAVCKRCQTPLRAGAGFCPRCGWAPGSTAEVARGAPPPKSRWLRNTWDVVSISGCAAVSGGWYWYSGMAETSPDYKTCAAIALAPVATVLFRGRLRESLRPLSGFIGRIPFLVRLGVSVAVPYLLATTLYGKGITEFPFMYKTTAYSVLLSALLLQTPPPRTPGGGK